MEEARAKANKIIMQHEEALQSVLSKHEQEAKKQMDTRLKAERVTSKQQLNMASSKAQLELKRTLGKTKTRLKKELFDEVRELLNDYMKTPEYEELLVSYVKRAAMYAKGEEMTIYINASDKDKKEKLEQKTGMSLTISEEDFIGGVRSVIKTRNILIDHAFKDALDREYHNINIGGGTGIE
ncbi:MAG TPA: V-type ATP synthase subunit E [Candidatus Dorea intestinavium]|nr:V-type ATP synthase subunit E [Candidatus Dorea intestinavium]